MRHLVFFLLGLLLLTFPVAPLLAQTGPFTQLDPSVAECVKNALGETRYNELSSGIVPFNNDDGVKVKNALCFQASPSYSPSPTTDSPPFSEPDTALRNYIITPSPLPAPIQPVKPPPPADGNRLEIKPGPYPKPILEPELAQCLKETLGEERYNQISQNKFQPLLEDKEKGKECFKRFKKPIPQPIEIRMEMPPELARCLKEKLGEKAFEEFRQGTKPPREEEMKKGEECFGKMEPIRPTHPQPIEMNLPKETLKCMQFALGEEKFKEMEEGRMQKMTPEMRAAGEKCFGASSVTIAPKPEVKMSQETENCLKLAVGEGRFGAISKGESVTTPTEQQKGAVCFEAQERKLTPDKILPPDPKQVPFVKENKDAVRVKRIEKKAHKTTISGNGPAGGVVDVYVYSQPEKFSVNVDQNGVWSLNFEKELTGNHTVYAVANVNNENVRSEGKIFDASQETPSSSFRAGYYFGLIIAALFKNLIL